MNLLLIFENSKIKLDWPRPLNYLNPDMKNITKELFLALLQESPTFRETIYEKVGTPSLQDHVEMMVNRADGEIAAIKAIKEFNGDSLAEIYPDCVFSQSEYLGGPIGLADAKRVAEFIREF